MILQELCYLTNSIRKRTPTVTFMENCMSRDLSPCRTHSTIPFHYSIPPFQSSDCRLPEKEAGAIIKGHNQSANYTTKKKEHSYRIWLHLHHFGLRVFFFFIFAGCPLSVQEPERHIRVHLHLRELLSANNSVYKCDRPCNGDWVEIPGQKRMLEIRRCGG